MMKKRKSEEIEEDDEKKKLNHVLVGVIMGSQSDWETMKNGTEILKKFGVPFETKIVSAHRTPERLFSYAKSASERGLKVIIAGAGGAAHLPGMVASLTNLPVLGVPIQSRALSGMDSLLSIVQMPGGVPVGCLAIGTAGATNAAILASSILASSGQYPNIELALSQYRKDQTNNVAEEPVDELPKVKEPISTVPFTPSISTTMKVASTQISEPNLDLSKLERKLFAPRTVIGIIGGGQLGKMIAQAATQLGYQVHIYCPDEHSPAFHVAGDYTCASYTDKSSLRTFASKVDLVTYEFENIPEGTIETLEKYIPVHPNAHILSVCQNRVKEKTFVNSIGIPTTRFERVNNIHDLHSAIQKIGFPSVLKSNTMGYDGKGQVILHSGDDIEKAWKKIGEVPSILEAFVDFLMEVSVIVARGVNGQKKTYPVVENRHQNHILKETHAPAKVDEQVQKLAIEAALKIAEEFKLIGVLAVEMFVTKDSKILVNEMAPRPHNSGHWTIEGALTSQFEQLVRAICGLPLGSTKMVSKRAIMKNLLGKEIDEWNNILKDETAHLHNYGKPEAREGRKMGHVTHLYFD